MAPQRQVIGDSDDSDSDDNDAVIFLRSPPARLMPTESAVAENNSSSTDPSFFRGVYEEQLQQHRPSDSVSSAPRDRKSQGDALSTSADEHALPAPKGSAVVNLDMLWDVPSSPEAAGAGTRTASTSLQHGTKRKRGGTSTTAHTAGQRLQIVISAAGGSGSGSGSGNAMTTATATAANKRRSRGEQELDVDVDVDLDQDRESRFTIDSGSPISLEPTDPIGLGRLQQQQLLASSSSSTVQHRPDTEYYGQIRVSDHGDHGDHERFLPPSVAATESTIAYPTPSRYAVLGPQQHTDTYGSDGGGAAQFGHLHDGPQEATPTRPRVGVPTAIMLPSSPDEIAEPWTVLFRGHPQADGAWEPPQDALAPALSPAHVHAHSSHQSAAAPAAPRKKRRGSDADELSSAATEAVAPSAPMSSSRARHSPDVLAEADEIVLADSAGEESVLVQPARAEPKSKKKKREMDKGKKKNKRPAEAEEQPVPDLSACSAGDDVPKKEAPEAQLAAATLPAKPKRQRGRPKRQTAVAEPPPPPPPPPEETVEVREAASAALSENEPSRAETARDSNQQQQADLPKAADPTDPADPQTSDGTTTSAALAPVKATNPAKKPIISSINTGQGRVPFRVGLSRKHRIAPLLKSMPRP